MEDITGLLTEATTLWTALMGLGILVLGFVAGRKLFKKGV